MKTKNIVLKMLKEEYEKQNDNHLKAQYKKYVDEWYNRYYNAGGNTPWELSNRIGDYYSFDEFLEHPHLHEL